MVHVGGIYTIHGSSGIEILQIYRLFALNNLGLLMTQKSWFPVEVGSLSHFTRFYKSQVVSRISEPSTVLGLPREIPTWRIIPGLLSG